MQRSRSEAGQATTEYVALVALVAVVLTLAAGLTSGGLGSNVLAGIQRGLCRVGGATCARPIVPRADLDPCPLRRGARAEQLSGTLAVLRLGSSGTLSAVRASDGRVTVTLADGGSARGTAGAGVSFAIGRRSFGGRAEAGVSATWTSGRSWTLPSEAAARRFVAAYGAKATIGGHVVDRIRSGCSLLCDAIGWRPHPRLPEPDEVFQGAGSSATLSTLLGAASAEASHTTVLGYRIRRDGTTTGYLQIDAAVGGQLGFGGLSLGGERAREAVLAYTVDRRGRPLELTAHRTSEATVRLAVEAKRGAGVADLDVGRGATMELDASLDLHDPANRAAALDLLRAIAHRPPLGELVARARALGVRFAEAGELDRRIYAVEHSSVGVGAMLGLGVQVGGALERTTSGLRLLSAETRLPGLPFLPRDDCRRG